MRQVADSAFLVRDLGAELLGSGEIALEVRYCREIALEVRYCREIALEVRYCRATGGCGGRHER